MLQNDFIILHPYFTGYRLKIVKWIGRNWTMMRKGLELCALNDVLILGEFFYCWNSVTLKIEMLPEIAVNWVKQLENV